MKTLMSTTVPSIFLDFHLMDKTSQSAQKRFQSTTIECIEKPEISPKLGVTHKKEIILVVKIYTVVTLNVVRMENLEISLHMYPVLKKNTALPS